MHATAVASHFIVKFGQLDNSQVHNGVCQGSWNLWVSQSAHALPTSLIVITACIFFEQHQFFR